MLFSRSMNPNLNNNFTGKYVVLIFSFCILYHSITFKFKTKMYVRLLSYRRMSV